MLTPAPGAVSPRGVQSAPEAENADRGIAPGLGLSGDSDFRPCLADFGTPVSCCHPDRTRMVEMAQGNIPFFEKNLNEIIRRNVRAGRLA